MSNNKQSSVEWLAEMVSKMGYISAEILEQAKAMHKDEIKHSYRCGAAEVGMIAVDKPEQYYNATFNQEQ